MIQARFSLKFLFLCTFVVAVYLTLRSIAFQANLGEFFLLSLPQIFAIFAGTTLYLTQTKSASWSRAKLGILFGGISVMLFSFALGLEITMNFGRAGWWIWSEDWPIFAQFLAIETAVGSFLSAVIAALPFGEWWSEMANKNKKPRG